MATLIKTLTDKDGNIIVPRTQVAALSFADGESLQTKLDTTLRTTDAGIGGTYINDADTLDGKHASEFASTGKAIAMAIVFG